MNHPGVFSLNQGIQHRMCAGLCALAAAGCGDGNQLPQVATIGSVQGGGVSGGALGNGLTVYAVDADSGQAVPDAYVSIGAGQSAQKVGKTGSDGKLLVSVLDGGPQTVSVHAAGYASATWGLVKSAIVTIPLESQADPPGTARVTLTVPGWADLPALAPGSYRIARFAVSRPRGLEALETSLAGAGPDCLQSATAEQMPDCSVTLDVPADSTALLAVIAQGNDAGTPQDPSDDELTMTALGVQTGLSLAEAVATSLSLPLLDSSAVAQATLATAAPPGGDFEEVIGVPGISLDGQILLYPSLGPLSKSFLVPTASGPFENAKLWAVGTVDNGTDAAWSRVYERGIDLPESSRDAIVLETPAFFESPSISRTGPSTYSLSADGNIERLEFSTPSGGRLNALLFPTQTEFAIPPGLLDAEPASVSIESFDLEVDLNAFDFADLARQATRIAYSRVDML